MRLAFISNHPAPYRDAFLDRLAASDKLVVDVYSLFAEDKGHDFWKLRKPSYNAKIIVKGKENGIVTFFRLLRFVFSNYDIVCWPGLQHWYLIVLQFLSAIMNRKFGFCADSVKQGAISRIAFKMKKLIVRKATFIFVPGNASVDFFSRVFNVSSEKLIKGAYALDVEQICDRVQMLNKKRFELRSKFGLSNADVVFLMVANMIKTRHYPITVRGFADFAADNKNCKFVIVGRGPDLEKMNSFAKENPSVIVIPGCSFEEMLGLYALADVYVHGGTEPASTALVIGAISGLPLISSYGVGCSWDVLKDDESGVVVRNYLDRDDWKKAFGMAYANNVKWKKWGARAHELAKSLDANNVAEAFVRFVKTAEGQH